MKKIILIIILLINININININAKTQIVMDNDTGRILHEVNMNKKMLIASTTKIMTFIIAYEYGNNYLDLKIDAGSEILKMYGTNIYLSLNEKLSLKDLLYGLMLRSGNDTSVVIATFIAGSEENFVKLMNKKAKSLGMYNTIFNNPHGLDDETKNYSSAYDMALLSRYANKIDLYKKITSTKYYKTTSDIKSYSWTNRNKLVFLNPYFVSGKTGYTPSAGRCLVSTINNNLNLTIVSLDDYDHYKNHNYLYSKYSSIYKKYKIIDKNKIKDILNINNIYIKNDIYYTLTESEYKNINIEINTINENNIYGEIIIKLNNKELIKEVIYNNKNINKISFKNKLKLFIKKILKY